MRRESELNEMDIANPSMGPGKVMKIIDNVLHRTGQDLHRTKRFRPRLTNNSRHPRRITLVLGRHSKALTKSSLLRSNCLYQVFMLQGNLIYYMASALLTLGVKILVLAWGLNTEVTIRIGKMKVPFQIGECLPRAIAVLLPLGILLRNTDSGGTTLPIVVARLLLSSTSRTLLEGVGRPSRDRLAVTERPDAEVLLVNVSILIGVTKNSKQT